MMAEPHDLDERLLAYGVRIIKVTEALPKTLAGQRIGDQLLRSGTSVGAHYEEAQGAESRADFVHKLQLCLKEQRESRYWLRLIASAGLLPPATLADILKEADELRAILSKAVATTKGAARKL